MKLPKNMQLWMPDYVRIRGRQLLTSPLPQACRVWLVLADHYEPLRNNATMQTGHQRVNAWVRQWPAIARRHRDSAGNRPVYTFFYPEDEYRPEFLDPLAAMTREGIADVDIHIHHDCEGEQNFVDRMSGFIEALTRRHGLLRSNAGHRVVFGFIHGNWALDNSHPTGRYCGLNNEIRLLRDLGCYADFTMPSASSPTQARMVNRIYWVTDDPDRPRSYDTGVAVTPGNPGAGDLLMIPGPLGWRYRDRLMPRTENGELAGQDLATPYRVKRWIDLAPRIGRDIFVKLHTHGAWEPNTAPLLEGGLDNLFRCVAAECARRGFTWRSVSAWQMRCAVDEAAAGRPS
jgi:hypothetical protein